MEENSSSSSCSSSWMTLDLLDDEYEKLVIRMNPPRVTVDNGSCDSATVVKVESANKHGTLLEVVQVLVDLNLTINRAYISSDGEWFMDVFYVVDKEGKKVCDEDVIDRMKQSLGSWAFMVPSLRRSVGVEAAAKHNSIELTGRDRPGLLSEIFAVLNDLKCNIVASEIWTHNERMAALVYVTDDSTGFPIDDPKRLANIKALLRNVLRGDRDKRNAKTAISIGHTHTERRLHQMMYADRDYDHSCMNSSPESENERNKPVVTVENFVDKGYSVVTLQCNDRPKLIFDTVCTLTDMDYVIFHGTVIVEGLDAIALQEYYIRHADGYPVSSEAERQRLMRCLQAAIERRSSEGLRLEFCSEDRTGLLSDVTRIFRENGLSVTRAEVTTKGSQAVNVFYVKEASGKAVRSETIEAIRNAIGETILFRVKDHSYKSVAQSEGTKFSLGYLFRSRSERLLCNLGIIRS